MNFIDYSSGLLLLQICHKLKNDNNVTNLQLDVIANFLALPCFSLHV